MNDMRQQVDYAIMLYCDNESTIYLTKNPMFH